MFSKREKGRLNFDMVSVDSVGCSQCGGRREHWERQRGRWDGVQCLPTEVWESLTHTHTVNFDSQPSIGNVLVSIDPHLTPQFDTGWRELHGDPVGIPPAPPPPVLLAPGNVNTPSSLLRLINKWLCNILIYCVVSICVRACVCLSVGAGGYW